MAEPALDSLPLAFSAYEAELHRLVEGQHYISTRRLVDSTEEQALLEQMLEETKPVAPKANSRGPLHYLLFTPFRYPPLKHGGRFHRAFEPSLLYAAEARETAMAEIAYYRFVFMAHSTAAFHPMAVPYTHFRLRVASAKAVLLTEPPFAKHRAAISDPLSYARSQALGAKIRAAGAEMLTFFSARWPDGRNAGLISPEALAANEPIFPPDSAWSLYVMPGSVEFSRPDASGAGLAAHAFPRGMFEIEGRLALVA